MEARQGGATLEVNAGAMWGAQVKPVVSYHGSDAMAGMTKWTGGLVLLALMVGLLMNGPKLLARWVPAAPAPSPLLSASGQIAPVPVAVAQTQPAFEHPQLTKSLFSAWNNPVPVLVATKRSAIVDAGHQARSPQVEGEYSIHAVDDTAASTMVSAVEPPSDVVAAVKPVKDNEDASGARGVVNKSVHPEQEVNLLIQRAVDQEQKGRLNEALVILRQALSSYPQSEDARQLLATYLFDAQQSQEAVALLQAGIKQFPNQISLSKALARWQLAHAQAEGVLLTLKPVANSLSQDAESQWMLAMAYQQTGQHSAALPHFDRATQLRPGHAQWMVAYSISLQAAGQSAPALQQLQLAYQLPLSERLSEFVGQRIRQLGGTSVVRGE